MSNHDLMDRVCFLEETVNELQQNVDQLTLLMAENHIGRDNDLIVAFRGRAIKLKKEKDK